MRARYNRGCQLCRFGDPGENQNPLGEASSASARIARSGTGRGAVTGLDRRGGPAIVMIRVRSRGRGRIGGGIAVGRGRARGSIGVLGFNPETGGIVVGRRGQRRVPPRRPLIEIDNAESGSRVEVRMEEVIEEVIEEEVIEPASPEYEDHPGP